MFFSLLIDQPSYKVSLWFVRYHTKHITPIKCINQDGLHYFIIRLISRELGM